MKPKIHHCRINFSCNCNHCRPASFLSLFPLFLASTTIWNVLSWNILVHAIVHFLSFLLFIILMSAEIQFIQLYRIPISVAFWKRKESCRCHGAADDVANTIMQRFYDSAFSLEPPDVEPVSVAAEECVHLHGRRRHRRWRWRRSMVKSWP